MSSRIETPLELFLDTDGSPLENGYIYIGEIGTNAEANPITVYWDEEYTIAAAQPIRTISGYASNNGTRSNIYVDGFYSIVIKDKNGVLIFSGDSFSEPNVTASAAEINILDGATLSTAELNYVTGVTSSIQTQLDAKASLSGATFTGKAKGITPVDSDDFATKGYIDDKNIISGTYTPIGTILVNLDTLTPGKATYIRVGNIVTVNGTVTIDPTGSGDVTFRLSLPIASDFASTSDASGLIGYDTASNFTGTITGSTANDNLYVSLNTTITSSFNAKYSVQYEIL